MDEIPETSQHTCSEHFWEVIRGIVIWYKASIAYKPWWNIYCGLLQDVVVVGVHMRSMPGD